MKVILIKGCYECPNRYGFYEDIEHTKYVNTCSKLGGEKIYFGKLPDDIRKMEDFPENCPLDNLKEGESNG